MNALGAIQILPSEPLARSGVEVLAHRWARSLHGLGWDVGVERAPTQGRVGSAVRRLLAQCERTGARALVVGLPADTSDAQSAVDAIATSPCPSVLLWERTGHAPEHASQGLSRLEGIAEAWVLNPLFRHEVELAMPCARVGVAPLAIPDEFFEPEVVTPSRTANAAFLGRFSASKRARELAERWVEEVWPATGVRLILAGRGMSNGSDEGAIGRLEHGHQGIRAIRLMSEKERSHFLARSSIALFPSIHDYLPQALGETVAVGTPVVATDIPGHRPLAPTQVVSTELSLDMGNLLAAVIEVLDRPEAAAKRASFGREMLRKQHSERASGHLLSRLLMGQDHRPRN